MTGAIAVRVGQSWVVDRRRPEAVWRVCGVSDDGAVTLTAAGPARSVMAMLADQLLDEGKLVKDVAERASAKRAVEAFVRATARARAANDNAKPKRVRPAPSPHPWRAVVLGVDAARSSGWAIMFGGALLQSGEANKDRDAELLRVCGVAVMQAERRDVPCVMVLEKPPNIIHSGAQASTFLGLGAARQAWLSAWRTQGGVRRRVVSVIPARWRGALGIRSRSSKGGLTVAQQERERALSHVKACGQGLVELGGDEAAAICIAEWGSRAGEVGAVLPAKLRQVTA